MLVEELGTASCQTLKFATSGLSPPPRYVNLRS